MPIIAPVLANYFSELVRVFGLWSLLPLVILALAVYLVVWIIRDLKAALAAKDQTIADLQEKRVADAREMIRVTRETEQARAMRRDLDERFLPVQQAMLQLLQDKRSP